MSASLNLLVIFATGIVSYVGFTRAGFLERYLLDNHRVLERGEYYRMFTSGFLHADWMHLLFNMLGLYFFGGDLESAAGPFRFLLIYVGSILGGGIASLALHGNTPYRALGASGGVYGVLLSHIFLFPGSTLMVFPIPVPLPSWLYAILFILASIRGIRSRSDAIGHDAHLGGAVAGLLLTTALYPRIVAVSPALYAAVMGLALSALVYFGRHARSGAGIPRAVRHRRARPAPDDSPEPDDQAVREAIRGVLLEKLRKHGEGSLSREERELLERLSRERET